MRRLYSTFATGLPGAGLLIMRFVEGAVLVGRGVEGLLGDLTFGAPFLHLVRMVLGLLVIVGLWTPVIGVVVAVLESCLFLLHVGDPWIHVLLVTLGICLALLGPGAWSMDARLFGWKRIDIRDRQGRA
jgi:hypothetical protein